MELTQEQLQTLLGYKKVLDDDNIRIKEIIKKTLIDDPLIIYLINNKELEEAEADPSEYIGQNILPFYLIHPTQHSSMNYLCFDIQFKEVPRYNKVEKYLEIYFYILCEQKNIIEKATGIARHDLLAARLKYLFNWTNKFGTQVHIVSDTPSVTDSDYATRTLVFEQTTPLDLVKTRDGQSRIINKIG